MRTKGQRIEDIKDYIGTVVFKDSTNSKTFRDIFDMTKPLVVELAMGKGQFITELASMFPDKNFIGVEIKEERVYSAVNKVKELNISNCVFINTNIEFLNDFFNKKEIDELWINFPDPWPKKKHTKRRLTSQSFLEIYKPLLNNNSTCSLKTDSEGLYNYTKEVLMSLPVEILIDHYDLNKSNFPIKIHSEFEKKSLNKDITTKFLNWKWNK